MRQVHLLHVFPAFETGGAQMRTVTLMNSLGGAYRHSLLSMSGNFDAAARLDLGVEWSRIAAPPRGGVIATARRMAKLLHKLKPDLLVTYNWGAIEAVIGSRIAGVCPLLHVEDGFGSDEAAGLKTRRVWTRRVALRHAVAMAVPSRTLERIALHRYLLPREKVRFIPNAVDPARFTPRDRQQARSALGLPAGSFVIGTVGRLRPEKDLVTLVRRFKAAAIPDSLLAIAGDGPCRAEIESAANSLGIGGQCLFLGEIADTSRVYAAFDVFAMTSVTEQMPIGLLEAMSSALPVVCTAAGDTADILDHSPARQFLPGGEEQTYVEVLRRFASEASLRRTCGEWNRNRVVRDYSVDVMVRAWDRLYRHAANVELPPAGEHQQVP